MTCLVAIKYEDYDTKGLLFAADSLVCAYKKHTESSAVTNKIIKKDDLVIACCGSLRTADIIKYQYKPNLKCFSKNYKEEFKEYIGSVLIPDLISLFRANNILKESVFKELIPKEQAIAISTRAINAAAHFDFYVDNNITFEFLEENNPNEKPPEQSTLEVKSKT